MTQRARYQVLTANGMKALGTAYAYVSSSGLGKPLIDLVFLRASQVNGCAYCIDMHANEALKDGASAAKLLLVSAWREAGAYFSERERAALQWTEAVTNIAYGRASDDEYAAASSAFTEQELADLTFAIALINTYNRMAIAFRRPPDSLRHLATA